MTDVVGFKKRQKRSAPVSASTADGSSARESAFTAPATSGFRKRARRRTTDSDDDDEKEANDRVEDVLQSIEQVLEDQRLRRELKNLESNSSSSSNGKRGASDAASSSSSSTAAAAPTQYGLHDPKKDGSAGQKLLSLLDGQFTGQSTTTQKDQHEELLNKYIDEKLGKSKAASAGDGGDSDDPIVALRSEEDALYALPEHLNPQVPTASLGAGDENGNGGVLLWSTGIAEVELPAAFKERTALATQRALERERTASSRTRGSSALPTNFSTNFNRQRRDYVADLKSLNRDEKRERGFRTVRKDKSSDDIAVSRFRKFESRRKFK